MLYIAYRSPLIGPHPLYWLFLTLTRRPERKVLAGIALPPDFDRRRCEGAEKLPPWLRACLRGVYCPVCVRDAKPTTHSGTRPASARPPLDAHR